MKKNLNENLSDYRTLRLPLLKLMLVLGILGIVVHFLLRYFA